MKRNTSRHKIDNSVDDSTCPSSASSSVSRGYKSPPQETVPMASLDSSQAAQDNMRRRMQVKLGRTRSPETLIGTQNVSNDNQMTEKPRDLCGQDEIRSAKENRSFGINKEQFDQNITGDMKNEGRRSMNDSRRSFYDYSDIYSVSMNKDGNMNPEVALDNIQINGMNETQYFDGQSIASVEAPENNEHEDEFSDTSQIEGEFRGSNAVINIQDRLEEEIQNCRGENNNLDDEILENESRPFSQKSFDSRNDQSLSSLKATNRERSIYRTNTESLKKEKEITFNDDETKDGPGNFEEGKIITKIPSGSFPASRQSRPSSCSLPVSCCSSRMSDVENNSNDLKLPHKKQADTTDENIKELGSYGDILNVIERIEKETTDEGNEVENQRQMDNVPSSASSRRSSATYFEVTPRQGLKSNHAYDISGSGIQSDNLYIDKHVRSSSKMR